MRVGGGWRRGDDRRNAETQQRRLTALDDQVQKHRQQAIRVWREGAGGIALGDLGVVFITSLVEITSSAARTPLAEVLGGRSRGSWFERQHPESRYRPGAEVA